MKNNNKQFLAFTIKYNGITNRIITKIKISLPSDLKEESAGNGLYETTALWDTGATKTFITKTTAEKLGLIPTGLAIINHAGGKSETNTYIVNIYLPNNVVIPGVSVTEFVSEEFGALIGMDIIAGGDFSITNYDNKTCMSFRIPSCHTIDYVFEAQKINNSLLDQYSPCPCGAVDNKGKRIRYGKCHGKNLVKHK